MATAAQDEFNELMRDKERRTAHPEDVDSDARSFLNLSDDDNDRTPPASNYDPLFHFLFFYFFHICGSTGLTPPASVSFLSKEVRRAGWEGGFWSGKLVKLESLLKAPCYIYDSSLSFSSFLPSTTTASF